MTEMTPAGEREKRSNTARLFIHSVPAERRFNLPREAANEAEDQRPTGEGADTVWHGSGTPGRSSPGQAPSLSFISPHPFSGRPRSPPKLRSGLPSLGGR